MSKLTSETVDAYGDAVSAAALARGTSRYDDAVANAAGARSAVIADIERLLRQRDQLLEALRELYAADAEFDKRSDGYNPRYATREQIDAYQAAENRRAVAQILAHAAIARAEGRSDE